MPLEANIDATSERPKSRLKPQLQWPSKSRSKSRLIKWLVGLGLFLLLVLALIRYSVFRITENFYEVDPGRFYRSAQLTPEELEEFIDRYKIRTVISLRGAPEGAFWYKPQVELLARKHVQFNALWWTAEHVPAKSELVAYLDLLKNAEYPILIHCRTGSDRTSAATAIYAIEKMGETNEEAIQQHMSFRYWHVPLFKPAMTALVRAYRGDNWVRSEYDICNSELRPFAAPEDCPK
ncbi:MAG: hypothetical protein C5B49_11700 [Bdellovibrio sp.]|nr:MAG: hypothetical protein C5B49_11700 [Bdellovibrio sp.]